MRVKRGKIGIRKRRKLRRLSKGFRAGRRNLLRATKEAVNKGLAYAYRDRRQRKREFRRLWIARMNAALRQRGFRYSDFIHKMNQAGVALDRKVLSDMSITDPEGFSFVVDSVMNR